MNVRQLLHRVARPAFVLLCVLAVAFALTPQALKIAGLQKAVWFSLTSDDGSTPAVKLVAETESGRLELPIVWDPTSSADVVYFDPGKNEVRIVAAELDGRATPLSSLNADLRWQGKSSSTPVAPNIPVTQAGLLWLPSSPLELQLTLESDAAASVRIDWRNTSRQIDVQPGQPMKFAATGLKTGWALLPPEAITDLAVAAPSIQAASHLRAFNLHSGPDKRLDAGPDCTPASASVCLIRISNFERLNHVAWALWWAVYGLLVLAGLCAFGLLQLTVQGCRWIDARYEVQASAPGEFLERISRNWTCAKLAATVGGVTLLFHAAMFLFVPMAYTSGSTDSLLYYGSGRAMAMGQHLSAVPSLRTPGYPMFIELTIRLFGDQVLAIGALQQLAVAAIGPAIVWLTYRYLGPVYSLVAGLTAGLSPLLSNTANVLWAETLQATLMAVGAIMLVLVLRSPKRDIVGSIASGFLVAAACLMRPASEMLLIVAVGGFACTWWFHRDGFRFWRGIAANLGIFIAGTLIVLAPWLKELHDREGTIGQLTVFNVMKDRSEILHPSSLHLVGWYNNTLFQDRLFADMDIQAPFRPYIRGNSVFSGFIFSQPEILWADDRYPGESTRESIRHSPGLYWRHVLYSTYYHAFFRMLQGYPFRAQSDILGWFMVSEMTRPRQSGAATVAELSAELDRLTRNPDQSGPPEQQRALERLVSTMIDRTPLLQNHSLANAALWPATVAGKIWPAAILLAVFSFVVALVLRPLRPMLVLSVLVSLTIFYHSLMGFANERYMVVIEPLVYVLAALVAYGLLCLKLKRIHPC